MARKEDVHWETPTQFWLNTVVVIFILLVLWIIMTPIMMKERRTPYRAGVMSNAKQVGILMLDFDQDFGQLPGDESAKKDEELKAYTGNYSNDYLGQLIVGGYIDSEEIFYSKYGSGPSNPPDNIFGTKEETLSEGECGFAYVKGLSMEDNSSTPVLMVPMHGDGYKFDPYGFNGNSLVLRLNGSVVTLRLNKKGHAKLPSGMTLFEGGVDSVWGESGFDEANLLYAKYPYEPVFKRNERSWNMRSGNILMICLPLSAVVYFFYRLWKFVCSRSIRNSASTEG